MIISIAIFTNVIILALISVLNIISINEDSFMLKRSNRKVLMWFLNTIVEFEVYPSPFFFTIFLYIYFLVLKLSCLATSHFSLFFSCSHFSAPFSIVL